MMLLLGLWRIEKDFLNETVTLWIGKLGIIDKDF